ncbi:hypothetical protein [Actinophytocola sediminis]
MTRFRAISGVLAALACVAATTQPADTTVWDGDWGVHDWEIRAGEDWGDSSVEPVPAPGGRDGVAGRFTVRPDGDDDDERAEASATQRDTGGYPGQEWYYEWSTYLEQAFYRNDRTGTGLVYHAGMRRHTDHISR